MIEPEPVNSLGARVRKRLAWIWVNFWITRSGQGVFGRTAARFAAWGYRPYKGLLDLARIQPKGYVAASAKISHANLTMGNNVFIGDRVIVYQHEGSGPVELGDRVMLFDEIIVETFPGGSLHLGADTAVQPRCHFTAAVAPIHIGKGVQIAPRCAFYSYDHGIAPNELIRNQPLQSKGPIIIEDDVWLGFGVIVLSGVHIGKGAVIGAGSVVTHDVPEGAVAVGSPARVVKMRSELSVIELVRFQGAAR
jgi:acetyltransferase-like isoleucine patch superfamily enzyme